MTNTDDRLTLKQSIAQQLLPRVSPLPIGGDYQFIVADPPWEFKLREGDESHRGRTTYPTMPIEEIKSLDVGGIAAKNAYILLWTTVQHQEGALECLREWKFELKSTHFWIKSTNDLSRIRYGLGHYGRNCVELVHVGMKGKMPAFSSIGIRDMANAFFAPIAGHSQKPEEFWRRTDRLVEALGNPKRIELFARERRSGWDAWGAEVDECLSLEVS